MSLRVLFTIPNFDTAGSGGAMLKIVKGLDPEVFEAHIACLHNRGDFFKKVEASGVPIHIINYLSPARPLSKLVSGVWQVSRQFKEIGPDLIHSYNYSSDYTEAIAAKLAGIPWVFTKKNMSWGGSSSNGWRLRSRLAKGIAIQNTDMRQDFYPGSLKTHYIPRGVDTQVFSPKKLISDIRVKMRTEQNQRVIICVANMVPVKGIELLIDAFSCTRRIGDDWILWLVGDINSDYGKALVKKVAEEKLDKLIRFSGKVSNIREYLDHGEIFVLPTKNEGRKEGSPVSLLEAMANAKVVLGSDIPGIRDQLSAFSDNLFEAGNQEALINKLENLMRQTKEENKAKGKEFQQCVQNQFPIEMEVARHEELYKTILKL